MTESSSHAAEELRSRTRALMRRLGSMPESPDEARAFLVRRIRLYLAIGASLWLGSWLYDRAACWIVYGDVWRYAYDSQYYARLHLTMHGLTGIFLLALREVVGRVKMTSPMLTFLEITASIGQVLMFAAMMCVGRPGLRPDLAILLAATNVLVLRAAIVPSRPRDTLVLGVINEVIVVGFAFLLYRVLGVDTMGFDPSLPILGAVLWGAITIVTTVAISAVIYGLRESVRAAEELGQYRLLEKLGEGGMGVVYKAQHALLRRPTAVKVLPPEKSGDETLARFEREVQLTAQITHPNIVSVYDFGRSPDGAFYYAMEYLDGVDLQRLVDDDGPQPPARVVSILAQVAEALAEAHAVGLIHRDIKPANVLVCKNARRPDLVKVFDFGLVKELGGPANVSTTDSRVVTGTPLYMSPEAITNPHDVDERSDLYALGAVAYFLLTGTPVFEGRTVVEVCGAHLHKDVEQPSERLGAPLPQKLEELVMHCLEKKRSDRPANATAFVRELAACGVRAWDAEEARAWWEHRPTPSRRPSATREVSGVQKTLAVATRDAAAVNRG